MNTRSSTIYNHSHVPIAVALIAFWGAVPPSASWAATYYVDGDNPAAPDDNPGTEAQPWKTISKATGLLQPGDTLLDQGGDLPGDRAF